MIRKVFGAAFIAAATIVPLSASAQGACLKALNATPAKVIVQAVQWVRSSEVRSAELSAVSPEF